MTTMPLAESRSDWTFLALVARTIVSVLFVVSAIGKIIDPVGFAEEVREYGMLPLLATNSVAYILPWIELFTGLLLFACIWRREARFIIAAMLAVFTVAKTWGYAHGMTGCGCGGDVAILRYIYDLPQGIFTNLILLGLLALDHRAERLARRARESASMK